ncbi:hypothetical protein LTR08_006199 [Meristemomyces frigidus]|nr:hypothetical protein LTR08_006199 [Meristemomyces frigidus]
MSSTPPLSQATGYGVVIGLGFLFAFGMMLTTFVLRRYNNELQTSEVFSTAGRSVKSGLVSCAVVSSWTWAATLLQSSSVAYRYGVSGPFWYASGATVQVILFATLAIELKRKAPNAHTFLEAIRARYGPVTHAVYIVFGLMTNVLVTAMLLTGGSAVVTSLTGVPTAAACFLLPVGVVLYTMFGGIKATFLTDYVHTVMILVIIFIFAFTAYATSDILGSPGAVYDALVDAAERHPVAGNHEGSYLTMRSKEGAVFFVINLVGNFGTVFCDNSYYNKAIAASPVHALPGYIAGGLSWFAIPWLCATTMGLSALALETNPVFPTYPNRMAPEDVSAGLVLPNAAVALLGKGGAAATLLLIFMAVTSAMSAELIAVSSIWTYDIYQTYLNPGASNVVALLTPLIFIPILSFLPGLKTEKYDWLSMKLIRKGDDSELAASAHMDLELVPGESRQSQHEERMEQHKLEHAAKIARILTVVLTLALLILWPMPMYGSGYIFSKGFFKGWIVVGILWLFCSSAAVGVYPVWEGRHTFGRTIKSIYLDVTGKRKPVMHGRATVAEMAEVDEVVDAKGAETPPEKAV